MDGSVHAHVTVMARCVIVDVFSLGVFFTSKNFSSDAPESRLPLVHLDLRYRQLHHLYQLHEEWAFENILLVLSFVQDVALHL